MHFTISCCFVPMAAMICMRFPRNPVRLAIDEEPSFVCALSLPFILRILFKSSSSQISLVTFQHFLLFAISEGRSVVMERHHFKPNFFSSSMESLYSKNDVFFAKEQKIKVFFEVVQEEKTLSRKRSFPSKIRDDGSGNFKDTL